ncbi:MAG: hypothetical protein JJ863_29965 [Deltaproteobacteria bacterium]|nr:hypothetical protein [Deltaproteobacteria bacterium]
MSVDRERVLHDVGKYVARTAMNLPEGALVAPALAELMLRDVYGRGDEPRMSETFDALVGETDDPVLGECRDCLQEIDALEGDARAGDVDALTRIATLARSISERLKAWARA